MTENKVYTIPTAFYSKLEKHIAKLQKRAAKLELEPIRINEIGRSGHLVDEKTGLMVPLVEIEIVGEMPQLAGWEFMGTIDHAQTKSGDYRNMIRALVDSVPAEYRTAAKNCDHCNTKRARKNTYIIRNIETGEFKQIGSTCLKDYLGHKDAAAVAGYLSSMLELLDELLDDDYSVEAAIRELLAKLRGESIRGEGGRVEETFELRGFLRVVYRAIRSYGWASRSKSDRPTADTAMNYLIDSILDKKHKDKKLDVILDDEKEVVDTAVEWALSLWSDGDDPYSISDYLYNLHTIAERGEIRFKDAGYAASILPAHWKAVEKEIERKKEMKSEYIGEIKKRQMFTNLELVRERSTDGYYGATFIYTFKDAEGNQLVWFTGNGDFEVGDIVSGKATVKEHKEYKGIKQTIITRAAFDFVEKETAVAA